jgi:hypothetical protein
MFENDGGYLEKEKNSRALFNKNARIRKTIKIGLKPFRTTEQKLKK